ncbi:MAG: hypothetical protein AAFU59_01790 [Pseudomonadota bacterium]
MTVTVRHLASTYDTEETAIALAGTVEIWPAEAGWIVLAGGIAESGLSLFSVASSGPFVHVGTVESGLLAGLTGLVGDPDAPGVTHLATARFASGVLPVTVASGSIDLGSSFGDAPVAALALFRIADTTWSISSTGSGLRLSTPTMVREIADTSDLPLGDVSAIATVRTGQRDVVVAASAFDAGLVSFTLAEDGTTETKSVVTVGGDVPASRIMDLETASVGVRDFVVAAGAGTSSLTVFEVLPKGGLVQRDHVTDRTDTRFATASVLEVVEVAGRTLVLAAGSDDGFSIFELSHGGKLDHLASVEDRLDRALSGIGDLSAQVNGSTATLAVAGGGDDGIALLAIDVEPLDQRLIGSRAPDHLVGGAGPDDLSGARGQDRLEGGAGDDVLRDGKARDVLIGGPGADIFALYPDTRTDRILDFAIGEDVIDLSTYPLLYRFEDLDIRPRAHGANIFIRDEKLRVESEDGTRLSLELWAPDQFIFA